jgi:hypothetical protein
MSNLFSFILGTVTGAYISQNYDIPNVKDEINNVSKYIKSL